MHILFYIIYSYIIKYLTMDKCCIFLFHLSTGDNFTMYAAVRHYQKIYKDVFIFCLHRNRHTVTQLYQPYKNVNVLILVNETYNEFLAPTKLIKQIKSKINNYDLFVSGTYEPKFNEIAGAEFWEKFYNQLKLPYRLRYDYQDINRNKKIELNLYNLVVRKYGKKYIFLQEDGK